MKLIRLLTGLLITAMLLIAGCTPAGAPDPAPEATPAPTAEPVISVTLRVDGFDGKALAASAGELTENVFTPSGERVACTVTEATELIGFSADDIVPQAVLNAAIQSGAALSLELLLAPAPVITAEKNGSAATLVTEPAQLSGDYASEGDDENALRVDGVAASLSDSTVTKSGGECTDPVAAAFGMNAALLAQNAATLAVVNSNIASDSPFSAAVAAYCTGTAVNLTDSAVTTSGSDSPGLYASGAGALTAANPDLTTEGDGSPALLCGIGSTLTVNGGSVQTHGEDSPALSAAGVCSISGAVIAANASEAMRITDGGSAALADCAVYGNMQLDGARPANVRILSSGVDALAPAAFVMTGGTLKSDSGDMFYVENAACDIVLSDVLVALSNDILLNAVGSDCTFVGSSQHLMGNFMLDRDSTLAVSLIDGCIFGGAVNPDNSGGNVDFTLDAGCVWLLTGDSYLSSFTGNPASITSNGYRVYVDGKPLLDEK